MYKEKEFNLKPQNIEITQFQYKGMELAEFQEFLLLLGKNDSDFKYLSKVITRDGDVVNDDEIRVLLNNNIAKYGETDEDIIFIHAPTGSGKTLGILLPTMASNRSSFKGRDKTIITEPTNSIIHELYEDISRLSNQFNEIISYSKITGEDKNTNRLWNIPTSLKNNDLILTNIDIISLYISGYYLQKYEKFGNVKPEETESWATLFRKVKTFVIDEYHAYSEESMAKVISLILLSKHTGNKVKFIFTSATPNDKFIKILRSYKINPTILNNNISNSKDIRRVRKVRGNLKLIFTDKPLSEEIVDRNIADTVMYMFDHKIDAEEFIYNLKRTKIIPTEYTGFANRRQNNSNEIVNSHIIVATNAAELGVNFNPKISHLEPGKYYENFWQRLGRTGRGTDGIIFTHVSSIQLQEISKIDDTDDYNVLMKELYKKILLNDRIFIARRVTTHVAAFLFAVWKFSSNDALRDQVMSISTLVPDFNKYYKLIKLASKFINDDHVTPQDKECLNNWIDLFFTNLGYFRGVIKNIKIKLPDNKITTDDYIYGKLHYSMEKDEKDGIFIVKSFLEKNNNISISYPGLYCSVSIDGKDLFDNNKIAGKFIEDCELFFYDYNNHKELVNVIEKNLYDPYLISKNFFVPREVVVENDDNIFL